MWKGKRYSKAIAAALSQAVVWGGVVVQSDSSSITSSEWMGLAGIAVTTLVVFLAPRNAPAAE
jgi:hypothetical protein